MAGQITSRNRRGGVTAIAGFVLVVVGVIGTTSTIALTNTFVGQVLSTGLPLPWFVPAFAAWLCGLCIAIAGGGVLLIGFARQERDREEKLLLDPLRYAPHRRPWLRALPWCVLVVVALVIPSLYVLPVATPWSYAFPVSDCPNGSPTSTYSVTIPSGATLAYHWSSSNGQRVPEVWAPDGTQLSNSNLDWDQFAEFSNSSYGNSVVQSNGSAIAFWACDFGNGPANLSIDLSGTYYTSLL